MEILKRRIVKKNAILKIINNYLYDSKLPININYWYNIGSGLGLALIIQIISGLLLSMNYVANENLAFESVEYIMREVKGGWLIRYIHSNGASIFFLLVYLHICRGFLYSSYVGERKYAWWFGVIILVLMIVTAFLGYTLVWGQMSYWAAIVITNLLSVIPIIGGELVELIWGGFSVSNATLNRFYTFHFVLPFILVGLVIGHLLTLHEAGGSNPLGINSNVSKIHFHPYYTLKDILGFIIILLLLWVLLIYAPNAAGHPDNYIPANSLVTPTHITPEWYMLPYYAILRSIPNKTYGVIGMLGSLLILLIMPYIHLSPYTSIKFRPLSKIIIGIFIIIFILLSWIGQELVVEPFITIGKILTGIYFIFFILLYPLITFTESFITYYINKKYILQLKKN